MPGTRTRERLGNTLLVVCSIVFTLALVELGLRMIGFSYPTTWRFDSVTGKALLAGAQMWNTEEGRAFVQINSDGLRDAEHPIEKPDNTLRIAILGDSYAEAMQVPVEESFWRVMAERLGQCPRLQGRRVEAINFGVSGFGTVQELLTLRHKVWKYSPDIVLLAFLTGNDIRNNLRELQQGGKQPYFVYRNGELVLDNAFLEKRGSRFMGSIFGDWWFASVPKSRVLQLLVKFFHYLDQLNDGSDKQDRKNVRRLYEQGLDNEIYSPPSTKAWRDAWTVTEDLLRLINGEVKAHNASFMLVTLSNASQVNPDPVERKRFADALGVDNLLYADQRIAQFARDEDIPFVMLAPELQAWAQQHGECVHGFDNAEPCGGHWNERGHRLAGTIIAENICQSPLALPGT